MKLQHENPSSDYYTNAIYTNHFFLQNIYKSRKKQSTH